ncbi:hypothetical protein [Microbacterium sp. Yaish 1]|uniref:hypothetical protein n=1 Tax=Microbacterium sp. Yaish 1 TaxID=2025014 RepID=UPI000B9447EF|nr:hypothetical protein [Microbacterium sp. Yaish 1]OYC97797.1 hypothetical protein CI089_04500 [Microbacterium sp. Yaish 1]
MPAPRTLILWAVVAATVIVAVVLAVSSSPESTWLPFAVPLAPLLLLASMRSRLQIVPLSPVWLIGIIIAVVGAFGYVLAEPLAGMAGGGIILNLPVADRAPTAYVYAVSVAAFCVGALAASLFTRRRDRLALTAVEVSPRGQLWMNAIALVPFTMVLIALGSTIISRDVYLAGASSKALFGLGQQLATATTALLGYVVAAGNRGRRAFALLLTVAYLATFFALGSRRLALLPIVFIIGMLMAKPTRICLKLAVAGAVAVVLLPLPLFLRNLSQHGLAAYTEALGGYDLGEVDWLTTINNVLISFPTTGMSAFHVNRLPLDYLWISINPLPGQDAGWYSIASSLTLNQWTPYSTLGELWNYGTLPALLVWGAFGVFAVILDRAVGYLWEARIPFVSLAIVGLSALFAIQTLQYNLRSSSRMLLYALLIAAGATFYIKLRDNARRADVDRAAHAGRRNALHAR